MLADAHIHLVDLLERDPGFPARVAALAAGGGWSCCAASHRGSEWERSESLRAVLPPFVSSFGIHPQRAVWDDAELLARLCAEGRIAAIGEAGFDFYGDLPERVRGPGTEADQRGIFEYQLGLAERHGLPLVLHLRKAMDLAFEYSRRLRGVPAAVFHSYSGTAGEAEAFVARGVNAYFSFGAPVVNGHKRARAACASVPAERLLVETDAPWQPPRRGPGGGPAFCAPEDLRVVAAGVAEIRGLSPEAAEELCARNFERAYGRAGGSRA